MGCYVNPHNESKEEFLWREGLAVPEKDAVLSEAYVPVCLVDNGPFTAAGVGFSVREIEAFKYPDGRPKQWFLVPREQLYSVSDLKNWE